jgi:high-affinity iron transporter
MVASFLLSLREGIEAALIIAIVLGALGKMGRPDMRRAVWLGTISAIGVSLLAGIGLAAFGLSLEGAAEEIFEGFAMLLAASVLTWMIFWMHRQSRTIKGDLEDGVKLATTSNSSKALFSLAFLAIVREGIELALFLTAAQFAADGQSILIGALLGLAFAVLLGYLIFVSTVRLNLRAFFQVTGFLLILFAAGLVAHAVHEFNEVGWIPSLIDHVWDINYILDEKSTTGLMFKALFGYNGNPSLTEVLAYAGYVIAITAGLQMANRPKVELSRKPA